MPSHHEQSAPFRRIPPIGHIRPIDAETRRTIQRRLARHAHGIFQSWKLGEGVPWRHRDERDLLAVVELDPEVATYRVTPERVLLPGDDGRTYWHVPSLLAWTTRGRVVLDAVPADMPDREAVVAAVQATYARQGVRYRALTGSEIRVEPRFGHVTRILADRRWPTTEEGEFAVLGALAVRGGRATVGELVTEMPHLPDVRRTANVLVLRGLVAADLSAAEPDAVALRLLPKGSVA